VKARALILLLALALLVLIMPQAGQGAGFTQRAEGWYAPAKTPNDTLDYGVDWTLWLAGDTITTSTWTVTSGVTVGVKALNPAGTITTIWISGGTAGTTYTLANTINTVGGRIKQQSFKIEVK
jgi:hypothetical protein